jgi:hypothetical protein
MFAHVWCMYARIFVCGCPQQIFSWCLLNCCWKNGSLDRFNRQPWMFWFRPFGTNVEFMLCCPHVLCIIYPSAYLHVVEITCMTVWQAVKVLPLWKADFVDNTTGIRHMCVLASSAYESYFVTVGRDNSMRLWQLHSGKSDTRILRQRPPVATCHFWKRSILRGWGIFWALPVK